MHLAGGRLPVNNRNIPASGLITILHRPQAGSSFPLTNTTIAIGRDPANDIVITDPSVSRSHARILYTPSGWSIEKLTDHNAVTVNQREVQQAFIRHNDNIGRGGITTFLFLPPASTPNYEGAIPSFIILHPLPPPAP